MRLCFVLALLFEISAGQTIYDIWQTTWDRNKLFTRLNTNPIQFSSGNPGASADISLDEGSVYQQMDGFGAAMSDSSAQVLSKLKSSNSNQYWSLLNTLFNPSEGYAGAGLTVLRVPIGASDFSDKCYTFDDNSNDDSFSAFTLDSAPSYLWSVLTDIKSVSQSVKLFLAPWSAPAWMKDGYAIEGGSLSQGMESTYAQYLFKVIQAITNKGLRPYAVSVQNEPQNSDSTYPTMLLDVGQAASVGKSLRSLLDKNGFSDIRTIGYDHNWDDVDYPIQLMQQSGRAFNGVAFHCYKGDVSAQTEFHNQFQNVDVHFTECTGLVGTDWWENIKWNMDRLFTGSVNGFAKSVMFWNLALHSDGSPKLPGTSSCEGGCRPVVSVDGSNWSLNEEYYLLAHSSRAVIPRDNGGPFANRIGVTTSGDFAWAFRVQAYMTKRANPQDPVKYTIVVLNWDDYPGGSWNPTPIQATISFRGRKAVYTFPVGVTTLWWYDTVNSLQANVDTPEKQRVSRHFRPQA